MKSIDANVLKQVSSQQSQPTFCKAIDLDSDTDKSLTKRKLSQTSSSVVQDLAINRAAQGVNAVSPSKEDLKYNKIEDMLYAPLRRANNGSTSDGRKKKRLSFHDAVEVVHIPMCGEYSTHVRTRLWASPMELKQNAFRNMVEFSFEG
jgi:hypothetical protein